MLQTTQGENVHNATSINKLSYSSALPAKQKLHVIATDLLTKTGLLLCAVTCLLLEGKNATKVLTISEKLHTYLWKKSYNIEKPVLDAKTCCEKTF